MKTLINSSPITLRWLSKIKSEIDKKIPQCEYEESTYWASFKSPKTNRKIAYLHPSKTQIRLFTRLPLSHDTHLQKAPSSGSWEERYPSIFFIRAETEIEKAVDLIVRSYEYDLRQ